MGYLWKSFVSALALITMLTFSFMEGMYAQQATDISRKLP